MARPKNHAAPDRFTSTEISVSNGISARNFEMLRSRGLAPEPAVHFFNQAGSSYWNTNGFRRTAVIGSFLQCGVPLLLAAQLAQEVDHELSARYYHLPSNFEAFLEKAHNPRHPHFPWSNEFASSLGGTIYDGGDFWLHTLLTTTPSYLRGRAMRGDFFIEIINRQYVFIGVVDGISTLSMSGERQDVEPAYRLHEWARSESAAVRPIHDEFNQGWYDRGTQAAAEAKAIEDEFFAARKNAVSTIRVNIGLAIRNGFDALHDYRQRRNAKFDWRATIKPPPDKYSGCFPDGSPVDPNHPWNLDLPPKERAKRLKEIEAYVAKRETECAVRAKAQ
jgi:hypothetical protein